MRNGHVAMRGQVLLTKSSNLVWEGRKKEGKSKRRDREREGFGERGSTFSLKFSTIGPSVFGKARRKFAPHGKDYTWVPVSGSFDKLKKGRGFSPTCFTFRLRAM